MDEFEKGISISLSLILEPPDPFSLHWLSGAEKASDTPIQWIVLHPQPVQKGDLVIFPGETVSMDRIREAGRSGAAAVCIIGDVRIESPPPDGMPVFQLIPLQGSMGDVHAAHRSLLESLLFRRMFFLERGSQIQTRLTQIAAQSEGLDGLAAAMRDLTQHSILVQDKRLQPLASRPAFPLRSVWDDLLDQLMQFSTLPDHLRDRRQAGETPSVAFHPLPGGLERMVMPIIVGDVARGYLSIIGPADDMDATDRLVAEQGALVCAIEMARAKAVRETEKRLHGDLLSALLHQTLSARDARLWAQNTGLDLEAQHTALRLAWDGAAFSLRRLETLVNGEVSRRKARAIVSSMGGEVICFCETPRDSARPVEALALALGVVEHAQEENPDAVARCGVGIPAARLSRWNLSFRQAGQALDMARRLDERKPLYYMDLSVYRLLLQIEDHPDLRAFPRETLGPILSHENAADLLATMEEYFAHNGNLSQTAASLFIHRNTLTYRMERIQALSGLDFDNPDMRLAAQLALRIHRMLKATNAETV